MPYTIKFPKSHSFPLEDLSGDSSSLSRGWKSGARCQDFSPYNDSALVQRQGRHDYVVSLEQLLRFGNSLVSGYEMPAGKLGNSST